MFSQCARKERMNTLSFISAYPLNNLAKINDDVNNNIRKIGNSFLIKDTDHNFLMEIKYSQYFVKIKHL